MPKSENYDNPIDNTTNKSLNASVANERDLFLDGTLMSQI